MTLCELDQAKGIPIPEMFHCMKGKKKQLFAQFQLGFLSLAIKKILRMKVLLEPNVSRAEFRKLLPSECVLHGI